MVDKSLYMSFIMCMHHTPSPNERTEDNTNALAVTVVSMQILSYVDGLFVEAPVAFEQLETL